MHKLIEYVCDELEELEKKADKGGKLSMSEVEYADKLAHLKKNLLKGEELYEESEDGYSGRYDGRYDGGMSYARGRTGNVRRDSMGRYSSRGYSRDGRDGMRDGYSMDAHMMADKLRDLMADAPDETTRRDIERLVKKVEQM